MTTAQADYDDDVVWSNAAYLAPALVAAWGANLWHAALMGITGTWLMVASGIFHARYTRKWQGLDVTAMMAYLASVFAVVAAYWTPWTYGAVPLAAVGYYLYVWKIDSYIHAPAWMLLSLALLAVQVQWWALVPLALLLLAGAAKLFDGGPDTELHSVWHLAGGAAAGAVLWLM